MVLRTIWKTSDFFVVNYLRLACLRVSRVFYLHYHIHTICSKQAVFAFLEEISRPQHGEI